MWPPAAAPEGAPPENLKIRLSARAGKGSGIKMSLLKAVVMAVAVVPVALACGQAGPGSGSSQPSGPPRWPAGQVVCLDFLGPTDRPVFPVILAAKTEDADAFVRAHGDRQILRFARRVIAGREVLDCAQGCLPGPPGSSSDRALLGVRIWTKKAAREIRLDGPQALPVLQALQKCLRKQSAEAASELNTLDRKSVV